MSSCTQPSLRSQSDRFERRAKRATIRWHRRSASAATASAGGYSSSARRWIKRSTKLTDAKARYKRVLVYRGLGVCDQWMGRLAL